MSAFFDVPVDAAYHVVSLWPTAYPAARRPGRRGRDRAFTMAVRLLLLPLSYRAHARDGRAGPGGTPGPGTAAAARRAAGPAAAGTARAVRGRGHQHVRRVPAVAAAVADLQRPVPAVPVPAVGGVANTLLAHDLFGAPLASYWLGGAGPVSAQGAVFAGLFAALAAVGWLSARMARRYPGAGSIAGAGHGAPVRSRYQPGQEPSGRPPARTRAGPPGRRVRWPGCCLT